MTEDPVREEAAKQLIYLARQLRELGDVQLFILDEQGVGTGPTLAEHLELIALQLDYDGCIRRAREGGAS